MHSCTDNLELLIKVTTIAGCSHIYRDSRINYEPWLYNYIGSYNCAWFLHKPKFVIFSLQYKPISSTACSIKYTQLP